MRYSIVNYWYSTGMVSRVYHPERTLEELLTVSGEDTTQKIIQINKDHTFNIVAHWRNDHWKMDKNYGTI
jgi:hypothetical protein